VNVLFQHSLLSSHLVLSTFCLHALPAPYLAHQTSFPSAANCNCSSTVLFLCFSSSIWGRAPLQVLEAFHIYTYYSSTSHFPPLEPSCFQRYIYIYIQDFCGDCTKECLMFPALTSFSIVGWQKSFCSLILALSQKQTTKWNTADLSGTWDFGKRPLKSCWHFT